MPNLNLPDINVMVSIVVGVTGLHFLLLRAVDRRIADKAGDIVRTETAPVVAKLTAIEAKLNNGILGASKEHGDGIQALQLQTARFEAEVTGEMAVTNTHLANLSSQLETLLRERR